MEEFNFRHDTLGEIIGLRRGQDIIQMHGLPFANIPKRFAQSKLLTTLPQHPFDARFPGPICPQPDLPYPQYWDGNLPSSFPVLSTPVASELACLNLNITVPRYLLSQEQTVDHHVPVLFFLHGGALAGGSQSIQIAGREIYDPTALVYASLARGQPILVVTANYRIGPLGFLASVELVNDNIKTGQAGNYGLHDQRRALEWCCRFIAGFGGDPHNITIQGSSAGGVSCHYHCLPPPVLWESEEVDASAIQDQEPLFQRAIIASGSFISSGPMPLAFHQQIFAAYVQSIVETKKTAKDPVTLLRGLPVEELLTHTPVGVRWRPFADHTWLKEDAMRAYLEQKGRKPDIMIGAAEYELEVIEHEFSSGGRPLPDETILLRAIDMNLANQMPFDWASFPESYPSIVTAYGLDQPSSATPVYSSRESSLAKPSLAFAHWIELLADINFRLPPIYFAIHASNTASKPAKSTNRELGGGEVFVYSIHATNPFPHWPTSYRHANHAINDIFVFDVAPDCIPARREGEAANDVPDHGREYGGAVTDIQRAWIEFCHGRRPWRPFIACTRDKNTEMGPVYVFRNGGRSTECASIRDAEGEETEKKWRAILDTLWETQ